MFFVVCYLGPPVDSGTQDRTVMLAISAKGVLLIEHVAMSKARRAMGGRAAESKVVRPGVFRTCLRELGNI